MLSFLKSADKIGPELSNWLFGSGIGFAFGLKFGLGTCAYSGETFLGPSAVGFFLNQVAGFRPIVREVEVLKGRS